MADFLLESHGRLQAQRQIFIAEQLSLTRTLFQTFRKELLFVSKIQDRDYFVKDTLVWKELEGMLDLFHSFDDTHSGVLKKARAMCLKTFLS